jgi:tetratricopeptide (TPR) repeat protein
MNQWISTAVVACLGVTSLLAQQTKGPKPKTQNEAKAIQAVFVASQQNNPDGVITAAEDCLAKFKDTEFKDTILFLEAQAYTQKGDKEKAQVYAERAVTTNANDYQAGLMLAELTIQGTREHDLDRDDKLAKAEKYANQAITAVNAAEKPNPQLSDQQWTDIKKDMVAQGHDALGMAALDRKDYEKAITEFKASVDGAATVQPAFEVRLASAYQSAGKNDEAIAEAEKVMNNPQTPQQIKSIAQSIRASAVVAKNGGKSPAQNSAPPQVQINSQPKQ